MALHVGSVLVPGELARETRVIRLSSGLSKAMGNKLSRSFWESRVPAFLPDNGHAVRCNSVGFLCSVWDNGCLITSGRSGRNLGGATSRLANSRNQGLLGHQGAINTTVVLSSRILRRTRGMRAIGGNANPRMFPQWKENASTLHAPGSLDREQYSGIW